MSPDPTVEPGTRSATISRCCGARSTASRWSTWISANTSQKPAAVIEAVDDFYRRRNANVSRAVHALRGRGD